MIKESIIFEGTPGEHITYAVAAAISKAKELNKDVFIRWNDVTIKVSPDDDKNNIFSNYEVELIKIKVYNMYERGELLTKTELATKIASAITKLLSND